MSWRGRGRGGWVGPWPGRGPFSYLPPWQRPGWLYGRGSWGFPHRTWACRRFPWLPRYEYWPPYTVGDMDTHIHPTHYTPDTGIHTWDVERGLEAERRGLEQELKDVEMGIKGLRSCRYAE